MHLYARNPQGTLAALATIGEDDEEVKVVLNPAGKIQGRVVNKDGKPLAGLHLSCSLRGVAPANPIGTAVFEATTDREGRFTFTGIVPGADCSLYGYNLDESQNLKQVSMKGTETVDLGDLTFAPTKK